MTIQIKARQENLQAGSCVKHSMSLAASVWWKKNTRERTRKPRGLQNLGRGSSAPIGHGSAAFHWDQSWANKSIQQQELCGLVANNLPASSPILGQGCAQKGNTLLSRTEMLPGGPAWPLPSTKKRLTTLTLHQCLGKQSRVIFKRQKLLRQSNLFLKWIFVKVNMYFPCTIFK